MAMAASATVDRVDAAPLFTISSDARGGTFTSCDAKRNLLETKSRVGFGPSS